VHGAPAPTMSLLCLNSSQREPKRSNSNLQIPWIFAGFVGFSCTVSAPDCPHNPTVHRVCTKKLCPSLRTWSTNKGKDLRGSSPEPFEPLDFITMSAPSTRVDFGCLTTKRSVAKAEPDGSSL